MGMYFFFSFSKNEKCYLKGKQSGIKYLKKKGEKFFPSKISAKKFFLK